MVNLDSSFSQVSEETQEQRPTVCGPSAIWKRGGTDSMLESHIEIAWHFVVNYF